MKFRVERDLLADAVAWTARALPNRPPMPVLGGLLLTVEDSSLSVAGFDYEVSAQVTLAVHAVSSGRSLVSGRLLADITRSLPPHPVEIAVDGPQLSLRCGNATFTLPTMPVEDYPSLPDMPTTAGTVRADAFATAVGQVAVAAGRDDTLPMLTGVRMEIDGERITLAATDRYRLAVRTLTWKPEGPGSSAAVLVPARTLQEAAKTLVGGADDVTIALSGSGAGEGLIGFAAVDRRLTTRLLDAQFPSYQSLWPVEFTGTGELPVGAFVEAAKRVSLLADRGTPVRLQFETGGVTLTAGGDDSGRAEERVEVVYDGEPMTIAFNPTFLLDGVTSITGDTARIALTTPLKPAVLSAGGGTAGADDAAGGVPDYRYLVQPVRMPG
ncbi:MAG: DNA polymerase III subunit beta [Mycobacteriales bacterium]|nr:MAG: DNA polymerase III subunit beta [Pseudonocardiales bacterium]